MRLQPIADRVILKMTKQQEKKIGSLYIPDNTQEPPLTGIVAAVGPGREYEDGTFSCMSVRVGDAVMIGRWAGADVICDDQLYRIVRNDEIVAIVDLEVVEQMQVTHGR